MSVVAYVGLMGHGKSYGAVENVIIPALKAGRVVVTNIPLKVDKIIALIEREPLLELFDVERAANDPKYFKTFPNGALICIDEAWRYFPAGVKASDIPLAIQSFFTEHRHRVGDDGYSQEIVLITQGLGQICKFVRDLIEETYNVVKLTAIGSKNSYRVDIYSGAVSGPSPSKTQFLRQTFGKYKPSIFECYQSHTLGTGQAGTEEKADNRANVMKRGIIRFGMPFAIIIFVVSLWTLYHSIFKSEKSVQSPKVISPNSAPNVLGKEKVKPSGSVLPKRSSDTRLTGFVSIGRDRYALLETGDNTRRIPLNHCRLSDLNPYCLVDGFIVDYSTGLKSASVTSTFIDTSIQQYQIQ